VIIRTAASRNKPPVDTTWNFVFGARLGRRSTSFDAWVEIGNGGLQPDDQISTSNQNTRWP